MGDIFAMGEQRTLNTPPQGECAHSFSRPLEGTLPGLVPGSLDALISGRIVTIPIRCRANQNKVSVVEPFPLMERSMRVST
jgi:hypothetical protein